MAHHPFADATASRKAITNRRRSTRVDVAVPIILSGRDATGQPFRDATHAVTINLHGARIQTSRQLLVGMQVTIESPRTGITEKAICVCADEPLPGVGVRYIAVQLVRPGNIWGLENPPDDWKLIEEAERPRQPAVAPPVPAAIPASTPALTAAQAAALEQQAAVIVEGAVERLRGLVEEMLTAAFEDFQRRLDVRLAAAEERISKQSDENFAQLEEALKTFRADLDDELAARTEQAVASAERVLRAQLPALVSSIFAPPVTPSAHAKTDLTPKK